MRIGIILFLSLTIFLSVFVNAEVECVCNTFCEDNFSCYFGTAANCTNAVLTGLDCYDYSQPDNLAEECPSCPSCTLSSASACVDDLNQFIDSPQCETVFKNLLLTSSDSCKQTIKGEFKNEENFPVTGATLTSITPIDGIDYSQILSNIYGNLTSNQYVFNLPRCTNGEQDITLIASKKGFGSGVKDITIEANSIIGEIDPLDFTLSTTNCNAYCTDSFNRCNPDCDGFSVNDSDDNCSFFSNISNSITAEEVKTRCGYKLKGTDVVFDIGTDNYTVVECCEGPQKIVPRPVSSVNINSGVNLVSVEKPVRLGNSEQGILKIFYWNDIKSSENNDN